MVGVIVLIRETLCGSAEVGKALPFAWLNESACFVWNRGRDDKNPTSGSPKKGHSGQVRAFRLPFIFVRKKAFWMVVFSMKILYTIVVRGCEGNLRFL